jgi:3-methyl-2-oxobutanoate hydroxymethyltransferase
MHNAVLKKANSKKIVMLTAYDYPTARLLDKAGVDMILVGDSLANVVLGLDSTTQVGIDEMVYHSRAVCRGAGKTPVIADMPASSMGKSAVEDARKLIVAGCFAVKIEWSPAVLDIVKAIRQAGIQVMGHVGLTPQTAKEMKVQGRDAAQAEAILKQAKDMEEAGCFAMVLECVPEALAGELTKVLQVPTIGIGAGKFCDGQVLVLHDMIGLGERKAPKFVKKYADANALIMHAVQLYKDEVRNGHFPGPKQSFH